MDFGRRYLLSISTIFFLSGTLLYWYYSVLTALASLTLGHEASLLAWTSAVLASIGSAYYYISF